MTAAVVNRRGAAYVAALTLLALFSTLGVALAALCTLNVQQSDNHRSATDARLAAESGLQFILEVLPAIRLPGSTTADTFPANLVQALGRPLNGTANLAGQTVTAAGGVVQVPEIPLDHGGFSCRLNWLRAGRSLLKVRGTAHGLTREIAMELAMTPRHPAVFDYGLASKGPISIFGNAEITGVNYPGEASVLSTTGSTVNAISIDGSTVISGDLSVASANGRVNISGQPTIAGSSDPAVYSQHIHFGVEPPDFPDVDVAPLAALATNVVNSSTNFNGPNVVLNNVRIAAGTNPTFSSKVTLNGVVYVEAPNIVKFDAGAVLNGLVVTQPSNEPLSNCQIMFCGHVEVYGVERLPNTAEFAAVKQQTGTFVAAPGFGVTFAGTFSAINGTIAADQLTFTGTAEGVVRGSVIGLKDLPTSVGGNVEIRVDRKNADPNPAGFGKSLALVPDGRTYAELKGGNP